MPAQRCVGRDAKDAIEIVGPIPVENFGTAIIAAGAQQDFRANLRTPSASSRYARSGRQHHLRRNASLSAAPSAPSGMDFG